MPRVDLSPEQRQGVLEWVHQNDGKLSMMTEMGSLGFYVKGEELALVQHVTEGTELRCGYRQARDLKKAGIVSFPRIQREVTRIASLV